MALSELWVCDILETVQEGDNDFLFYANLQRDGRSQMGSTTRCIFQSVSYDINEFVEDTTRDGFVELCLVFGKRTAKRPDAPGGWKIAFKVRHINDYRYEGKIWTSWWGVRNVVLLRYDHLSIEQQRRYPDLNAKHHPSLVEVHAQAPLKSSCPTHHLNTTLTGDVARGFAAAAAKAFVGGLFEYVISSNS